MVRDSRWAEVVAALPEGGRATREAPFWRAAAEAWGWRRVADAGCGAGFHLSVLRGLGVTAWGFDLSPWYVPLALRGRVCAGDLAAPPLWPASVDAALCLGNTVSLLPDRESQKRAIGALAALLRPGGVVLLQWEDAGAVVAGGAVTRSRQLADGRIHLRTFVKRGERVQMLAGITQPGEDASLEEVWLLPTDSGSLVHAAARLGLTAVDLPSAPPGSVATSWLALQRAA